MPRAGRDVFTVETEGYEARIEVPRALAAPLRSALRDLQVTKPTAPDHVIRVTLDRGTPLITADGLRWIPGEGQSLCDQIIYVLMRASLDAAPERLHLHGGYVAREGRGILVAGYPMVGKSTLVAQLVETGFDYFTDERVGLGRDGSLTAFEKPISLTAGSFDRLSQLDPRVSGAGSATARLWHVPVTAVRDGSLGTTATPTAVVFLEREDDVALEVAPVRPVEMARLLLSDSPDAGRFGADAVEVAARFCASVHCRRIVCADVDQAIEPIHDLAALDPPRATPAVQTIRGPASHGAHAPAPRIEPGARVGVAPGVAGVLVDDQALMRTAQGEIVELPAALSAWLQLLDGEHTLGEIVAEVAAENEMSEDAVMNLARAAVGQLSERSLVR